jgi:putative salt-induced outer membrane protein YdiY
MKKSPIFMAVAAAGLVATMPSVSAQSLTQSLQTDSSVKINIRSRFEDVTEDTLNANFNKNGERTADAWTTRTRISYQSGAFHGFSVFGEVDNISEMTNDVDYRTSAANTDPLFGQSSTVAVIGDPTGTDVNQAYIAYTDAANQAKWGRQRIILDNARFIGNVGWRQNEQTYDAFSWVNKSLNNTQLTYAYINRVNRVAGADNELLGYFDMDSHIVNGSYTFANVGKLVGYAYLLDVENPQTQLGASSDTFGVRWQGQATSNFTYNLEAAIQQDAGANKDKEANYSLIEGTYTLNPLSFTLGYEVLGSDDGTYGFSTPLATLHGFQGWADKLTATPLNGLEDVYGTIGANIYGVQAALTYHKYDSHKNDIDLGSEWNVSLSKKIGSVAWLVKFADYSMGDNNASLSDTRKFWVMADWSF